jgi:hypothetical protein
LLLTPIPETSDISAFPTVRQLTLNVLMLILKLFPLFIIYCCYSHQQDLTTTAESEPDMMKMHTPVKRSGEEAPNDDPNSAKLSSNKITLRSTIKKEKLSAKTLED